MSDSCKQLVVGNQVLGTSKCQFHAGGGSKSLSCGISGAHDEDAPIWHRLGRGTRIKYIVEGTARHAIGEVVGCEGNCDHMVYEVRPLRAKQTIKITGWSIVEASGQWKS